MATKALGVRVYPVGLAQAQVVSDRPCGDWALALPEPPRDPLGRKFVEFRGRSEDVANQISQHPSSRSAHLALASDPFIAPERAPCASLPPRQPVATRRHC